MKHAALSFAARLACLAKPGPWCAVGRVALWICAALYFGFVALVLALRYVVLPNIEVYRPQIEQLVSDGVGQRVAIGRIEANWDGINPDLTLFEVRVADAQGRPALAFDRVEAILSWWSVPSGQLALRLLRIDEPTLNLRRDPAGAIFIAGIPLAGQPGDSTVADWILRQRRIRIGGATLVWQDELRAAPDLILDDVNLELDNDGSRHRFGLTALPPPALAARIDLRGDLRGKAADVLASLSGQVYAEIAYADLAVWRQWLDYPLALPQGSGALRSWLTVAQGRLREITADLALNDVRLRLADELPELPIERLAGRLGLRFSGSGFAVSGRRVELTTRAAPPGEAIRVAATDFAVDWQPTASGSQGAGNASADRLDLAALAQLAAYLPLDPGSRRLLADYLPQGRLSGLDAKWTGSADGLQSYTLKTGFESVGIKANGVFPGFSGLSGSVEASERGGSVSLDAGKSTLDLPAVFPEPLTRLDSLAAQAKWKIGSNSVEVDLARLEFAGPEAAGSARGKYRSDGNGPGSIDLTAALTRADARAVWRYMPHAVGRGAREWLRDSLLAGQSSEAKLILRGKLADFPFLDKRRGQFLVTVQAHNAVIDYAKGWPRIEDIHGELRFEGNGMVVDASRGTILGARLGRTHVEIPDFDAPVSTLTVKGQASGPTAEFLKFIAQSPVAERIDHFTDDLHATGNGQLDLALTIPLDEALLGSSKVDGSYRLINNEVVVDSALPAIKQVNGSIQFSGSDLRVPEINGTLFGGPLKIKGGLQKDGRVVIAANGSVNASQLRRFADSPLLERLSGTTSYRGEVRINKRNADIVIETPLLGIASTLPEPLAKAAGEALNLRFEKINLGGESGGRAPAVARDQINIALGSVASAQLIRRKQNGAFVVERGALAVGRPLQLPESGVALSVSANRLDLDAWQQALLREGAPAAAAADVAAPAVSALSLKVKDLQWLGRHLNNVDASISALPAQWSVRLASRQASGDLLWHSAGSGKLTARFKHLTLEPASDAARSVAREAVEKLPALDVTADEFNLGARRFGRLDVQARNEGGTWQLTKVELDNPYGKLSGSGAWQLAGGRNRTQLEFEIDSSDVGKLLERLGYPGAVRAGTAHLGGKLGWNGAPTELDFASLSGDLALTAKRGQFIKLDPGAGGKLLALISLQGLPRRITLDFRDVFSEGLAFDSIESKLAVSSGVMRTDRLLIDGPSARIVMRGEVDLKRETQRLTVNVQPDLSTSAAIGVGLINPLAGVATLLAQKVLQGPLNQIFSFDYLITGSWDDPKVDKLGSSASPAKIPTIDPATGARDEPAGK